ncbi:MAG: DUF1573 domain-containing protein [Anaerolineales bacterium]
MISSRKKQREIIHQRAERHKRRSRLIWLGSSALLFVILVSAIWSSVAASQPADHRVDSDASQVVYDQPIQAVHEMTGSDLLSIAFLPADDPQPKIVFSEQFFDFKKVGYSEVVQHEFVITNGGEAPLTISRAYTTCECTTADFTGTVIPPGKTIIVTVTFDAGAHDVRGQLVRRGVIIESNDPARPQTEIWTQASVNTTP